MNVSKKLMPAAIFFMWLFSAQGILDFFRKPEVDLPKIEFEDSPAGWERDQYQEIKSWEAQKKAQWKDYKKMDEQEIKKERAILEGQRENIEAAKLAQKDIAEELEKKDEVQLPVMEEGELAKINNYSNIADLRLKQIDLSLKLLNKREALAVFEEFGPPKDEVVEREKKLERGIVEGIETFDKETQELQEKIESYQRKLGEALERPELTPEAAFPVLEAPVEKISPRLAELKALEKNIKETLEPYATDETQSPFDAETSLNMFIGDIEKGKFIPEEKVDLFTILEEQIDKIRKRFRNFEGYDWEIYDAFKNFDNTIKTNLETISELNTNFEKEYEKQQSPADKLDILNEWYSRILDYDYSDKEKRAQAIKAIDRMVNNLKKLVGELEGPENEVFKRQVNNLQELAESRQKQLNIGSQKLETIQKETKTTTMGGLVSKTKMIPYEEANKLVETLKLNEKIPLDQATTITDYLMFSREKLSDQTADALKEIVDKLNVDPDFKTYLGSMIDSAKRSPEDLEDSLTGKLVRYGTETAGWVGSWAMKSIWSAAVWGVPKAVEVTAKVTSLVGPTVISYLPKGARDAIKQTTQTSIQVIEDVQAVLKPAQELIDLVQVKINPSAKQLGKFLDFVHHRIEDLRILVNGYKEIKAYWGGNIDNLEKKITSLQKAADLTSKNTQEAIIEQAKALTNNIEKVQKTIAAAQNINATTKEFLSKLIQEIQ